MTALPPCPACGSDNHEQSMDVVRIGAGHMRGDVRCLSCGLYCARARWVSMLRPTDIVAARIEGLREATTIFVDYCEMSFADSGELDRIGAIVDARIAELEATAPEVGETRARAEAFDAFLGQLARVDPDSMPPSLKAVPAYCRHWMLTCLAEAKRKGAGT